MTERGASPREKATASAFGAIGAKRPRPPQEESPPALAAVDPLPDPDQHVVVDDQPAEDRPKRRAANKKTATATGRPEEIVRVPLQVPPEVKAAALGDRRNYTPLLLEAFAGHAERVVEEFKPTTTKVPMGGVGAPKPKRRQHSPRGEGLETITVRIQRAQNNHLGETATSAGLSKSWFATELLARELNVDLAGDPTGVTSDVDIQNPEAGSS